MTPKERIEALTMELDGLEEATSELRSQLDETREALEEDPGSRWADVDAMSDETMAVAEGCALSMREAMPALS